MKKEKIIIGILSLLLLLFIGTTILTLNRGKGNDSLPIDSNAVDWQGNQSLDKQHNQGKGIAIPGFDTLVFVADQTAQKVNFYNPEVNSCLFLFTLYVEDVVVWQSGYVQPGSGFYNIELSKPLTEGAYNGHLRIQCFKADGTVLNSAKVDFNLIVQREEEMK